MTIYKKQKDALYNIIVTSILSMQHVVVLFVGIILPPVMLGQIYHFKAEEMYYIIFVSVLGSAFSTLLQLLNYKNMGLGSPMFMGTSSAFMSCAHAAIKMGGFSLFCSMALLAAPFQILFSYIIRYMRHLLTPTVGGVIIMLAMVGLLKDSVNTWIYAGMDGISEIQNIAVGGVVILSMIIAEWFGQEKLRPWGLFVGILGGTILEIIVDGIDFTPVIDAAWLGLPPFHFPEFSFEINNFKHWATYITFIVATQVVSIKYVGDAMALQRVKAPEQKKTNFDAIQSGLYANSIGIALTSAAGGMPPSSHSPNIPLMQMTGAVSRKIALVSTIILLVLVLSPKAPYLLATIPGEVMGAAGVVLVAHLFSTGMHMVVEELDYRNGVIAGLSLCMGLISSNPNFFPNAFPEYIRPLTGNGVAVGGLTALILTMLTRLSLKHNILFHVKPDLSKITYIKNKLHNFSAKAGISETQSNFLELACEEIFVYALTIYENKNVSGRIRYKVYKLNEKIFVEISFGSRLDKEIDAPCNFDNPEELSKDELNKLGLFIIGKVVDNISHQTIGEYCYICFSISKK